MNRKESKGSARLPAAAVRALADSQGGTHMLTGSLDLTWAIVAISNELAAIDVLYSYKGKGKDPSLVKSFRALGLADPLLSVVVDMLLLRLWPFIDGYVGAAQLGGRGDQRYLIIAARAVRTMRQQVGLPTVSPFADA